MDIVIKEHPSTSRLALLEGFVDAHFDPETGAPACGGFFEVFTRLGRKDLNFGLQAQKLGRLSTEEETFVRDMYSDRCNDARNAKKHLNAAFSSIANDCRENPFYKQLSTAERLVFQALSADGKSVVNPAAATTLAQAVHERWFEVPNLFLSPTKLLRLCANQGDAHAAYLLATRQTPDEVWLEKSATARKKYLDHANWVGHQSAYETIRQVEEDEWRSDFQSDEQNEWFLDYEMDKWREATERAPTLEGEELLDMGILLNDASFSLMIHNHPDFSNETAYEGQVEIALGWIRKAAATSSRAKHWLATSLFNRLEVTERIDLLSAAARPKSKANPFHPALVDMAEIYADRNEEVFDLEEAKKCLDQAIEKISAPDTEIAIRLADLDERLNDGQLSGTALELYINASKSSAYATFRAGLLALRMASSDEKVQASRCDLDACLLFDCRSWDTRNLTSQRYAEVGIAIGWGGWKDGDEGWDEAAVMLVQQLHEQKYRIDTEAVWLRENDIHMLFNRNPDYAKYKSWRRDIRVDENLHAELDERSLFEHFEARQERRRKFLERRHYAVGACDPLLFLKGIIAVFTRADVSVDQLKRDYQMDRITMLSEFLFGQLYLCGRFGVNMKAAALGHFEQARNLITQWQNEVGGQGIGNRANLLHWLEAETVEGIKNSQPSVRRMVFEKELDGPANKFGDALVKRIFTLIGKDQLPGIGAAIRVRYRDRYINTPFKVALLAHWMAALMTYLKEKNRWQVKKIEVETDEMTYTDGTGAYNQAWFVEPSSGRYYSRVEATKHRDDVLTQTLARFGIAVEIPKVATLHDRELTVTFDDGYELQVDLGQGLSHWRAVNGGEELVSSFDHCKSIEKQVEQLIDCTVNAGGNRVTNGFVEWRKARMP